MVIFTIIPRSSRRGKKELESSRDKMQGTNRIGGGGKEPASNIYVCDPGSELRLHTVGGTERGKKMRAEMIDGKENEERVKRRAVLLYPPQWA